MSRRDGHTGKYPTVSRTDAGRRPVRYVLDRVFGGSVTELPAAVAESAEWTEEELDETGDPLDPGGS